MADFSLSHITMWLGILAGAGVLYVSLNSPRNDQQTGGSQRNLNLY